MSGITRSNGRDLASVRRSFRVTTQLAKPVVVKPVVETQTLDPGDLNKADLSNLAVAVGVEASGTKPEVLKRVTKKTDG